MDNIKLYMLLLGCKPQERFTEQHDIFFGAGHTLKDLLHDIQSFWPGNHKIHIDAWRKVTEVDGYRISLIPKSETTAAIEKKNGQLFFLNLGGYKADEFEEFHYKMLVIAKDKAAAIEQAKQSAFYKHAGFEGAHSHIDDKYGVDVDDLYEIEDILPVMIKENFFVHIERVADAEKDIWHLGYTKLSFL